VSRSCRIVSLLLVAGLTVALAAAQTTSTVSADERAIRAAEAQWSNAASAKELERTLSFYTADAAALAPGSPAAVGIQAIRAVWVDEFKDPASALSWHAQVVQVSRSGDLGYARGSYQASYTLEGKPVHEYGKYLTVWKKQPDGSWKVAADMYSPDAPPTPIIGGVVSGVVGGVPGGVVGGIPGGLPLDTPGGMIGSAPPPPPPPPARAEAPPRVRVGQGVMEANLIYRVDPVYPALARQARIAGTVVLSVVVGKDGSVENLKVISGHPLLVQAAVDAVKQWRYKPYLLNGEPVEIQTTVTVPFSLQ
jgi:uncharacterized protein (TIGR02246 family)